METTYASPREHPERITLDREAIELLARSVAGIAAALGIDTAAQTKPIRTCSIAEAAEMTGLSEDYLRGQSKIANPAMRLPGIKSGRNFRVLVDELAAWQLEVAGRA